MILSNESNIKYHYKIDHPNVIKFYGFSKGNQIGDFMLMLQHANDGNLRDYLQKKKELNYYKILWTELLLYSKNILINDGKALIADFGISRQLNGSTTSSSAVIGMIPYIDPLCLENENKQNKKSDIYSLGVIFWELTSGIPPFNNFSSVTIIIEIINGTREKMVENTPLDYANLYNRCWSSSSDQRPTLNESLTELEKLSIETNIEFIINDISTKIDVNSIESYSDDSIMNYSISESNDRELSPPTESFIKRVELINGNLMINCPVPLDLLKNFSNISSNEFTNMRYTACTCKPDNFKKENFTLRQIEYEPSRETELFVLVTVNDHENGWKKVVVCIISNGRNNINERALAYLAALGAYQSNIAKSRLDNKVVKAHIYEYTTQISIQSTKKSLIMKTMDDGIFPTQILFCLKEKEKDNADTFQWFFNAFCPILNPKICGIIKAGVKPGGKSIYNLWKAFLKPHIAGACGKLVAMKDKTLIKSLNPIVGAQIFEQEISNILDRPSESIFGYIQILPENFSAYRYLSLQDIMNNIGNTSILSTSYLKYNYLLCFDLVSKHNRSWILHYESSSQAEIDISSNLSEFIHQQRYRLNHNFFATLYAFTHFYFIWKSGHSILRKIFLQIKIMWHIYHLLFLWSAPGIYYTFLFLLGNMCFNLFLYPTPYSGKLFIILICIYCLMIFLHLVFAFSDILHNSKWREVVPLILSIFSIFFIFSACLRALIYDFASIYNRHYDIYDHYYYKYDSNLGKNKLKYSEASLSASPQTIVKKAKFALKNVRIYKEQDI
ncbi:glycosyltransferase family 2 protein [Gigaspora margarita]|uniref:Chitin synthase n=1 Tax=Gigaspora margarita TaxID=4874 RepID=A0A8H4ADT5_GIGMA|nr:glycosyltransferase family 2 protein [Gigaspora margarita]